ncbi:MAG: hypothetical protein ACK4S4_05635 [Pyrinomonadaceae bacterium]
MSDSGGTATRIRDWHVVPGSIFLLYFLVRFWRLDEACLWFDEIFGLDAAARSWGEMLRFIALDLVHPPLFYILLKLWVGIGGESVAWVRLLPFVLSLLAVIPILQLCRELKLSRLATVVAFAAFAVNGSLIKYAQEVRMYSLTLLLAALSYWLFARFFFRGKNIWLLTAVNVLLVYTHYFGWFVVLSEALTIALLQRIKIGKFLTSAAITLLAFLPWTWAIWRAASTVDVAASASQNIGWIDRPGIVQLFDLAFDLIEPFYFQQSSSDASTLIFITAPLLIILAAAKLIYLRRLAASADRTVFCFLAIVAVTPVAAAFAISWLAPHSIWGTRHLTAAFIPITILAAIFLTEIGDRWIRRLLLYTAALLAAGSFAVYAAAPREMNVWCAWESLAVEARSDAVSPERVPVLTFEDLVAYHFWFALRDDPSLQVVRVRGAAGVVEDAAYFLPRDAEGVSALDASAVSGSPIFAAFRLTRNGPGREAVDPSQREPLAGLVQRGYTVEYVRSIDAAGQTAYLAKLVMRAGGGR